MILRKYYFISFLFFLDNQIESHRYLLYPLHKILEKY